MELYLLLFGSLVLSIASPIGVGLRVVERLVSRGLTYKMSHNCSR